MGDVVDAGEGPLYRGRSYVGSDWSEHKPRVWGEVGGERVSKLGGKNDGGE